MDDARSWLTAYRLVMDLPDDQVRRARLEGLDQDLVSGFYSRGLLLAHPRVVVRFEEGNPQGHVRAGARAEHPGLVIMRSRADGQVNDALGRPTHLEGDGAVIHRWSVLLHEAAHFSFEQLPASRLADAFPVGWEDVRSTLAEHLWAPFLSNLERTRLNEAFADGYSSALLMGWASSLPGVHGELESLASLREWGQARHTQVKPPHSWVHGPAATIRRVMGAPAWEQCLGMPSLLLDRALVHSVGGVVERWRSDSSSLATMEEAWCSVQLERVCEALLHARRHHDTQMVEQWLAAHPTHPIMQVAQTLRWRAPVSEHTPARPWHVAWEEAMGPHLPAIGAAWESVEPLLESRLNPRPRPRLTRPR